MERVVILQYERPLQIHTVNLALAIASSGCHVDLFLKGCGMDFVDLGRLRQYPNVKAVDLDSPDIGKAASFLWRALHSVLNRSLKRISYLPIILPVVFWVYWHLRKQKNDLFIGVEKVGMVWACFLSRLTGIPFVYYSLELYDEKHPFFEGVPGFSAVRRLEKKSHRNAAATIVQDDLRRDYLFHSNGLNGNSRAIMLPVSVTGSLKEPEVEAFVPRRAPNVPDILYLGWIDKRRYVLELARAASRHNKQFRVVFHGWGEPTLLKELKAVGGDSVILSTEMVSEDRLSEVAASADIGLAIYGIEHANDRLTAFSSEKVALYCQAGIPFISFDTPSYRQLLKDFQCCVLIRELSELSQAVEKIMSDYPNYSTNAFEAFKRHYDFERNIAPVIRELDEVSLRKDS